MVAAGEIHCYLADDGPAGPGGAAMGRSRSASDIASWVAATFDAGIVDGVRIYDLSAAVTDD